MDSDPLTWNMNVKEIESKINSKTKAILVVHIYGLPVDMEPVIQLAKKHNLKLIEDAAEVIGQNCNGKKCGSFGDISIFSFYPNKHITTGEGGMILCNNEELAEKCRYYRNLCFEPGRRFVHKEIGWNYRITNMQAALGLAQLEQIDTFIKRKREIGRIYNELLTGIPGIQLPCPSTEYAENIYWVYGLVVKPGSTKNIDEITSKLSEAKIGTRPFFWCMHEQPVFIDKGWYKNESYPAAELMARNGFYLPSGLGISNDDIYTVASTLKKIISG